MELNRYSIKPKERLVIRLHPYLPIEKNPDGTGGGFTARLYGAGSEPEYVRIVWGETTEIEILARP